VTLYDKRTARVEILMTDVQTATIYRMILPDHTCPFGVRAKQMLEDNGFAVEDHILKSREEVDAYEAEQGVATTPQIFIAGECVGGCDELEVFLARQS
jgi:glutaredoxin 3